MIVNDSKIKFDGQTVEQVMQALADLPEPVPFYSPFALQQIERLLYLLQAYSTTKQGISLAAVSDSGSVYSVEWLTLVANNPETLEVVISDLSTDPSMAHVIDELQVFLKMQESPETYSALVHAINATLSALQAAATDSTRPQDGRSLVVVPEAVQEPDVQRNRFVGLAMMILSTAVIAYCLFPLNGVSS